MWWDQLDRDCKPALESGINASIGEFRRAEVVQCFEPLLIEDCSAFTVSTVEFELLDSHGRTIEQHALAHPVRANIFLGEQDGRPCQCVEKLRRPVGTEGIGGNQQQCEQAGANGQDGSPLGGNAWQRGAEKAAELLMEAY